MKVVIVNNYDLLTISELLKAEQNNAPAQHLWGYTELDKYNISAQILPFEKYKLLKRLCARLTVFGDLDQQFRILQQASRYDVIYSGHYLTTLLLSFLRSIKLLNKPIVAIAYQSPRQKTVLNRFFIKLFVAGNDKLLCLSEDVLADLVEFGVPRGKLELIEWGVDLRFYQPLADASAMTRADQRFIFSPGKTYRDYGTLIKAFDKIEGRLRVCAFGNLPIASLEGLPPNVDIDQKALAWPDLIETYRQSYAVAIPIDQRPRRFHNAIGLTNLTEAIAVGKPVVMTRNEYVGIDLEKEKIGLWVAPADVGGWRQAITYLLENPAVVQEMGDRARFLAERKFNLDAFAFKLAKQLRDVASLHCLSEVKP